MTTEAFAEHVAKVANKCMARASAIERMVTADDPEVTRVACDIWDELEDLQNQARALMKAEAEVAA